jgi:hypothetical protein
VPTVHTATGRSEQRTSVLSRIIRPDQDDLSPEATRSILKLRFEEEDLRRMHELAEKNQRGELSEPERSELGEYRQAGLVLDLLQSRARLSLKRHGLREGSPAAAGAGSRRRPV